MMKRLKSILVFVLAVTAGYFACDWWQERKAVRVGDVWVDRLLASDNPFDGGGIALTNTVLAISNGYVLFREQHKELIPGYCPSHTNSETIERFKRYSYRVSQSAESP